MATLVKNFILFSTYWQKNMVTLPCRENGRITSSPKVPGSPSEASPGSPAGPRKPVPKCHPPSFRLVASQDPPVTLEVMSQLTISCHGLTSSPEFSSVFHGISIYFKGSHPKKMLIMDKPLQNPENPATPGMVVDELGVTRNQPAQLGLTWAFNTACDHLLRCVSPCYITFGEK